MSKQGGEPNSDGGAGTMIAGVILVAILGWIIWSKFHTQVNAILGYVRLGEIALISIFTNELARVAQWIRETPAQDVAFDQAKYLATVVGVYIRWLLVPLIGLFWYLLLRANRLEANKSQLSLRTLMKSQLNVWPQNTCVANTDLVNEDPRQGEWASAQTEIEFALSNGLLHPEEGLDRVACEKVFREQLGPRWKGWNALKPHAKAVFAILVGRIASIEEKGDDFKRLVDDYVLKLAREMPSGTPDYSWVQPTIEKAIKSKRVQAMLKRHAYEYTMIAGLLEHARVPGVLPSCDFRWLKPIDRRLFYIMNCVGRRTAYAEVAGIFGHWIAERAAERAFVRPYFHKAVDGLDEALQRYAGNKFVIDEDGQVVAAGN